MRRHPRLLAELVRQLLSAVVTLGILGTCVFFALRVLPGDPTSLILGDEASSVARAELRHRLGLDASLGTQWVRFFFGLLHGDMGESLVKPGVKAATVVARSLVPTAELATLAVLLGTLPGVLAAVLSVGILGPRARSAVHVAILFAASVPLLAFGPFLTWLLAVHWAIVPLPGDPDSGLYGLLFPSSLLSVPLGAQVARVGRATLLDQSHAKYLDAARARGASAPRVWFLHGLPVAAPAIVVIVAMQFGALLGGAVVLERLFERPGLGTVMLESYRTRDLPVLQAAVIAAGALFVFAQMIAQLVQSAISPERREERARD
ncbi:MAG TPA: ABC transporter permease [Polyangiaceae bacterium]|nr:ABC transporter permease [Polyangiaceae bacterium]